MRCARAAPTEMYFPQVTAELIHVADTPAFIPPQSKERGHTVMYLFALLAPECTHSPFGTQDIHPVRGSVSCLARGVCFLGMCNHMLQDCSLLSGGENDELAQVEKIYQMSLSSGLFSSHAHFHCVRCLIEVLLNIVMILSHHQ